MDRKDFIKAGLAAGPAAAMMLAGEIAEAESGEGSCFLYNEPFIANTICDASYKPLYDYQLEYLADESRLRILCSANRLGKTHTAMSEALMIARGSYSLQLGPGHRSAEPATEIWIGCKNLGSYKRFIEPAFEELCPDSWLVKPKLKSENYVDIWWNERHQGQGGKDCCRIWFVTYDMDVDSLVGAAVDHIWFDEEPPRAHVIEALARIASTDGSMLMTFTPILGIGWWYQGIWRPALAGRNAWSPHRGALAERDETNQEEFEVGRVLVPHFRKLYDRKTRTYRSNPACTCEETGYCQACRQRTITFASSFPDIHDRLIRVFGYVRGRQGLIYKDYAEEVHKIDPFPLTREYEIWAALDPGFRGLSVIFGAIDPKGRVFIVDEIFSEEDSYAELFAKIAKKVRKLRPNKYHWLNMRAQLVFYIDTAHPEAEKELNIQSQEYVQEQLADDEDFIVDCTFALLKMGLKAQLTGFRRVQTYLQPRKRNERPVVVKRASPDIGEPRLYFFNTLHAPWRGPDEYHECSRVLWEIDNYKWKPPPRESTLERDEPDKDSAQGAHAMDALRYFIMARLAGEKEFDDQLLEKVKPSDHAMEGWEREQWRTMERELRETKHDADNLYMSDPRDASADEYEEYY